MNKFKAILILAMLSFTSLCYAYHESTMTVTSAEYQPTATAIPDSSDSADSVISIPKAGILFAAVLFGVGLLGRRQKKVKTNVIIDAFSRTS